MSNGRLFALATVTVIACALLGCGGSNTISLNDQHQSRVLPGGSASLGTGVTEVMPSSPEMFSPARFADAIPMIVCDREAVVSPSIEDMIDISELPDFLDYPVDAQLRDTSAVIPVDLSLFADITLNVNYAGGTLTIPSSPGTMEWAHYAIPLSASEDFLGLSVTGSLTPAAEDSTGLWIGLSNYSQGNWVFLGPYDLAAQLIIDDIDSARYGGIDNMMHIMLITHNGDRADLTQMQVEVESVEATIPPDEFGSAILDAGINYNNLSLRKNHALLNPEGEWSYGNWGWYIYSYDGTNYFEDLRTMLPTYWSAWSGATDAGFFEPHEYPQYMENKRQTMESTTYIQDLIMAGMAELPEDRRIPPQDFNPTLDPADPLARAIEDFVTTAGGTADFAAYQAAVAALSLEDRTALAGIVAAVDSAYTARDTGLTDFGLTTPEARQTWFDWAHGIWVQTSAYITALIDTDSSGYMMRLMPYDTMVFTGSCTVADAVDSLTDYIAVNSPTWQDVNLDVDTPAGRVVISGTGDDVHNQQIPPITGKVQGTNTYTVAGDLVATFAVGMTFSVVGATDDNGLKTVTAVALNGPDTDITVAETLSDSIADGEIHLNGYAILIDLGGNDTYECTAGATASGANGIAVCIEMGGNDTYLALDDPLDGNRGSSNDDNTSQYGAARLGTGVLVDYEGADSYNAVRMSNGFAMLAVGVHADYGEGDDVYNAEGFCQGSAIGGIGILYDDGGGLVGNEYNIWGMGQGYGGVMGVGMLVQHGLSDDAYYAEPDYDMARPEYNSGQLPDEKNANFTQGAALGMRWGAYVNPSTSVQFVAAGGYGLLYDAGGNDSYVCGIFGQGCGYFQGHGLMIDGAGNDTHTGVWYTQGATAHCGLAGVWDNDGDDTYNNEVSIGVGGAHDMSVTWFYDVTGNDTYHASSLAVGTGFNQGYGFFIDVSGNDTYNTTYSNGAIENLGRGGWPAPPGGFSTIDDPAIGIFVDARGADFYDFGYAGMLSGVDETTLIETPAANGAQWIRNGGAYIDGGFYANGKGSGIDGQ